MSYIDFTFLSWSKRLQRSKKSPGVFEAECSRNVFAGKKGRDQTQTKSMKKNKLTRDSKHPLLNTENKECPFGRHSLNQFLFFLISADTAISEIPIFLYGKYSFYPLHLHEDWLTCRTASFFLSRCSPCFLITGS